MGTDHEHYFAEAGTVALGALCSRAKCGAVIVKDGHIIGRGYNAPPAGTAADCKYDLCMTLTNSPRPRNDRTCCMHAEWRAVLDGLKNGADLSGSTIYFTRVDTVGALIPSGEPHCTVCSRIVLDAGIKWFALWHENGIKLYDTYEFNELSYRFHQNPTG